MNVCVFCGSSRGTLPVFQNEIKELARLLALHQCTLVYGGGKVGLMGVLADEVLRCRGRVIGVIPDFLLKLEVGHEGLTELEVVSSMHERKKRMADLSDFFIAAPGGMGTLDELAEILTWKQLGLVNAPIGILNTNSYFDLLYGQMQKMVENDFLKTHSLTDIVFDDKALNLLTRIGVIKT